MFDIKPHIKEISILMPRGPPNKEAISTAFMGGYAKVWYIAFRVAGLYFCVCKRIGQKRGYLSTSPGEN